MKKRTTGGYEEEIVKVVENKAIEYKITDGVPSSAYFKARILFKSEEADSKCRIIWTIWWTPDSMFSGMMYTMLMVGSLCFCSL
jgi:hypothetical protein